MTNKLLSRRNALRLMLAGSMVAMASGCETLDSLQLQPAGSTDGSDLAIRVKDALRNNPQTAQLSVNISSSEDEVIIKGTVLNQIDIENVEIIANQVDGVRHAVVDLYVRDF